MKPGNILSAYDKLVLFDTETTGLDFPHDEIIEFSAVVLQVQGQEAVITREYDELICLSPGKTVPPMIEKMTGISTEDIARRGIPKAQVCRDLAQLFDGDTLLIAYNAHFDLSFLFYLLLHNGDPTILRNKDKLDLLTVYKDRRDYPHKLCNAIESYGLSDRVVNSHRAIDDVLATVAVMEAMAAEKDDLSRYINLFGYHPKYGIEGKPISSVRYKPQSYRRDKPLYEDGI